MYRLEPIRTTIRRRGYGNADVELWHSTRLIYHLDSLCRILTINVNKLDILSDRPQAMAVRCLGWINPICLSTKVALRNPFCVVEISVEESICILQKATKESSW